MVSKLKEVCLENKEPLNGSASGYPCPTDDDFQNNLRDPDKVLNVAFDLHPLEQDQLDKAKYQTPSKLDK